MKLKLLLLSAALLPSMAMAQAVPAPAKVDATYITLNVTERLPVKQDVVVSSIRFETKAADAKTVQSKINEAIKKGLDIVKAEPAIKVSTEQYSVYMNEQNEVVTDKNGKQQTRNKQEWRGQQALSLESKDPVKMQDVTAKLQALGFAVSSYGYTLSPEKAESVRETLMTNAVDKLKKQAATSAKLLGKSGYEFREVNVDGGYIPPQPMMFKAMRAEAAMADASMPAPNAEAGESDVQMTLNARVELKN